MEPTRTLEVAEADAGERLDAWLARELGLTRGYVRRLFARGVFRLAGRPAVKGTLLRAGDRVQVGAFRHPDEGPALAPGIELRLLARGEGLLAFEKPAGLASHPLDYEDAETALGAVGALYPEVLGVGDTPLEGGLVHRLDTGTSGVLVLATDRESWQRTRSALKSGEVDKVYLARVHGRFEKELDVRLRLDQRGPRVRVVASGGRPTLTHVRPLRANRGSTLVEVRPATGMRHQIRVAFSELGHPILGDELYGSTLSLGRHLLHSARFALSSFRAESPTPPELLEEAPT